MDAVVTLPLTAGNERSFLTLFTPLISHIVSKAIGAPLIIMQNNVGYKSNDLAIDSRLQYEKYVEHCGQIGISGNGVSFKEDASPDYQTYFEKLVKKVLEMGLVNFQTEEIMWCQCGRTEALASTIKTLAEEKRRKSLIACSDTVKCKCCNHPLESSVEDIAVISLNQVLPENIWPPIYFDEFKEVSKRMSGHSVVISRNHRSGFKIKIGYKEVTIDTDFRWFGYLGYFCQGMSEVLIVSSLTTLNQLAKVIAFSKLCLPELKISILIHPVIRVKDGNVKMSSFRIEEYLRLCQTANVARFFLASCMQWNHGETTLTSDEIGLVKLGLLNKTIVSQKPSESLAVNDLFHLMNRKTFYNMLKCLRNGKMMTLNEVLLKNLIFV